MKKHFTAGVALLLPLLMTVMILAFLIHFITEPFLHSAEGLIKRSGIFQSTLFSSNSTALTTLTSRALILLLLFGFILLVGIVGKHFIIDTLVRLCNRFFNQIPYVNKIYMTSHNVAHSLFSSSSAAFTRVVYVPFPHTGKLSLGFVTCDAVKIEHLDQNNQEVISVFVPGTPNPTAGFLLLVKKDQLLFVNMKVDEAMRFVVSCGTTKKNPHT